MSKQIGTFFAIITSFGAGFMLGLLAAPKSGKENREWLSSNADEAKHWLEEKGTSLKKVSEKRISGVAKDIRKTVKDAVPDLYEATEDLRLENNDLDG